METIDLDQLKQIDSLLASSYQAWLLGAGISIGANIPLMFGLTARVFDLAAADADKASNSILIALKGDLPEDSHIEHILSHIGDMVALAERCRSKKIQLGDQSLDLTQLRKLHDKILQWISEIVRWGYVVNPDGTPKEIGTRDNPVVKIDDHTRFINALFNGQAGVIERRGAIKFFTTNYDTLLEDALALGCFSYWDGFSGGALAFRNYRYGQNEPAPGFRAHLVKMHGSIDWHLGADDKVWRVRDSDRYPERSGRVLIYPQSTKYLATQRDPFSSQFDLFRRSLSGPSENVLAICGYSFGDEHINQEIELALHRPENRTTIIAFASTLNPTLEKWRSAKWAKRLYIVSSSGVYVGPEGPYFAPSPGSKLSWWTFDGVAKLLTNGAEASIS